MHHIFLIFLNFFSIIILFIFLFYYIMDNKYIKIIKHWILNILIKKYLYNYIKKYFKT